MMWYFILRINHLKLETIILRSSFYMTVRPSVIQPWRPNIFSARYFWLLSIFKIVAFLWKKKDYKLNWCPMCYIFYHATPMKLQLEKNIQIQLVALNFVWEFLTFISFLRKSIYHWHGMCKRKVKKSWDVFDVCFYETKKNKWN